MHEKSVMDQLMKKIFSLANEQNAKQVTKVSIWLGALSHMSKGHFKEHFNISSAGTIAENATIEAEESNDLNHPDAMSVVLKSIDIAQ